MVAIAPDSRAAYWLCAVVDGELASGPPDWRQVWAPATVGKGNYAVVFQQPTLPVYALVAQGTHNHQDVVEDFDVMSQVLFQPIAGAKISQGSSDALTEVLGLTNSAGQTLRAYLNTLAAGVSLTVTGHSLGGNIASVMLPWIAANVPAFGPSTGPLTGLPKNLLAVTFAAPTAGNQPFADFLNTYPDNYAAYFNANDVVPNVWATSGPLQVANIYSLFPSPGPPTPQSFTDMLKLKVAEMKLHRVAYTQTNGKIFAFQTVPGQGKDPWLWELGYQHNYAYCRTFLGDQSGCKPPA
jgi:hypothetical protein